MEGSEMWIMVEPIAEIPFRIHQSPTWCYGCNILVAYQTATT
jgi:hypothetical protein